MFKVENALIGAVIVALIWGVTVIGWVANIVQVVSSMGDNEVTTLFITKLVGIPVAPLGVVLGWIGIF